MALLTPVIVLPCEVQEVATSTLNIRSDLDFPGGLQLPAPSFQDARLAAALHIGLASRRRVPERELTILPF